jgi:hypothetical protein
MPLIVSRVYTLDCMHCAIGIHVHLFGCTISNGDPLPNFALCTYTKLGVQSDPSAESFAPPSTDLQLQSLTSSSATSPTNHDRINRENTTITQLEEELSSSLAQLNLQDESEETEFTTRHDCVGKSEGLRELSVDKEEQNRLTKFHHLEEKRKTDVVNSKGKRDKAGEEDSEWRSDQYSAISSGDLKGKRTCDKLAGISEEKEEETDDGVLEWRISDAFSGLSNDSPRNHTL